MAVMNLSQLRTDAQELLDQTLEYIRGLENEESSHVTLDERRLLDTLLAQLGHWRDAAQALLTAVEQLQALNYPNFPTLTVPEALREKLQAELEATQAALSLLQGQASAVEGSLTFQEPEEKPLT